MYKIIIILTILLFQISNAFATTSKVNEIISDKGYKAWIIEDHYLPIISIKFAFTKSGSAYDTIDKQGLSFMVSNILGEGAGTLSSFEYRKQLEALATTIEFEVDDDNFYASVTTLEKNLAESLKLLNLAITQSKFEEKTITRIRNQIILSIEKNQENPEYVASRKFATTIFNEHPYGRSKYGTADTIKAITNHDLKKFISEKLTSKNIVTSIVGDITQDNARQLLDKYLTLPTEYNDDYNLPEVTLNVKASSSYIYQNIPQSIIIFGGPAVKRNAPEFYPAYILNHILGGGGFESRLMHEVREKNGLAYTIYSYLETLEKTGILSGYVGTDNLKVNKSLDLIKQQISKIGKDGVNDQELQNAKDYLINSFPLKMTKNSNLASFLLTMQIDNLGIDFLEKRNDYVNNVSKVQVNNIARELMDISKMTFIIVGGNEEHKN